ncbi:TonB-dependent receptor [Paraferrimonas sp. SM1919]|uniref:TonB-dependent receptor n=1 Tax=Paraferrimonas sp. SM1919 TaxID=2662263 RepID=UPI0013D8C47F|nr:TonB-dependent receptor [Paraferrimonas sp. SM1919]
MRFPARKTLLSTSVAIAITSIGSSQLAIAAEQPTKKAKGSAALMEVIEVKSRKKLKAEPVQDTPLSVTVMGEDQLDALNVTDLSDLSYSSPGVQFEEVGTFPGVQNFSFRGQGINSSIPSVDPTVGTFVDGMFLGVSYGVVMDMFDVESVEVLRGPQGLLFGRNVTGGAVSIRTKRPTGDFGGKLRIQATDHQEYTYAGTLEGSLIDNKLYGKVVAYHNNDNGYFTNNGTGHLEGVEYLTPNNKTVGALDTTFMRGTLVYDATEDLQFTLIGESGSVKGDGGVWQTLTTVIDPAKGEYLDQQTGKFTTSPDGGSFTDGKWQHAIFETNFNLSDTSSITNIFAYRDIDFASATDLDGSSTPIFEVGGTTVQDQISNELRYATSYLDGDLDLTVGHYYFKQNIKYLEDRFVAGGALKFVLGGTMEHVSQGAFVSADYQLTEKLSVSGGARYTYEDKQAQIIDSSNGFCQDVGTYTCEGKWQNLARDWNSVTPKLGVDYKYNDDVLLYSFWTKGFRSGGVNFRNAKPNLYSPGPTNAEGQDTYEFGFKSDLLDNKLRWNAAYFFADIKDKQSEINVPDPDVVVLQATLNAGDVEIQGIETDFIASITDNFNIMGSFTWLNGKYTRRNEQHAAQFGDDLPRLAPISYTLSGDYTQEMDSAGFMVYRVGYSYRDKNAYSDDNLSYFPESNELTAKVEWNNSDGDMRVGLYGKNLLDEARYGNITSNKWGPMQKGRVIGIEVNYLFE